MESQLLVSRVSTNQPTNDNVLLPVSYPTSSLNLKGAKMFMDAAQHIIRWQHIGNLCHDVDELIAATMSGKYVGAPANTEMSLASA